MVDELGGLEEAIVAAADMAELEDYKIRELPFQEDPMMKMLKELSGDVKISLLGEEMGEAGKYYRSIKAVLDSKGIYARLPVDILIK